MKQHFIDKKAGISYIFQVDCCLPNLIYLPRKSRPIGIWWQRHLLYLKQHCKALYTNLLTSGKLNSYPANINEGAENIFSRFAEQMANLECVTKKLKAENRADAARMSSIRNRTAEIVSTDIIYA